jgi:hypothetical protein
LFDTYWEWIPAVHWSMKKDVRRQLGSFKGSIRNDSDSRANFTEKRDELQLKGRIQVTHIYWRPAILSGERVLWDVSCWSLNDSAGVDVDTLQILWQPSTVFKCLISTIITKNMWYNYVSTIYCLCLVHSQSQYLYAQRVAEGPLSWACDTFDPVHGRNAFNVVKQHATYENVSETRASEEGNYQSRLPQDNEHEYTKLNDNTRIPTLNSTGVVYYNC